MNTSYSPTTHGYSYSHTKGISRSESRSVSEAGTPIRSYAGDPATIARCIFHDELRDALIVLKNCGALRIAAEREWCVMEMQRLLLELFSEDAA
jgi:hypothetical protein